MTKHTISIGIDHDIIAWLRIQDNKSQTVNKILRDWIEVFEGGNLYSIEQIDLAIAGIKKEQITNDRKIKQLQQVKAKIESKK